MFLMAVSMVFTPVVNAFGADIDAAAQNEAAKMDTSYATTMARDSYKLVDTADKVEMVLEDTNIKANGENKQVKINIIAEDVKAEVSDEAIVSAYDRAMAAYRDEMATNARNMSNGTFDYTLVGEDEIFFYEQTADSKMKAEMNVICLTVEDKDEIQTKANANANATRAFVDNGFYGRLEIYNTTKKYSSCTVTTPLTSQISVSNNGVLYIYGGFSASGVEADMGLQYSPTYDHWKPCLSVNRTCNNQYVDTYDKVGACNGFVPGTDVNIVCHPYNDQAGTKGSVRLKLSGLAQHTNMAGDGGQTYLTSITETKTVYNVSSVKYHKWLATIAGATFSNQGNGTITIDVKH